MTSALHAFPLFAFVRCSMARPLLDLLEYDETQLGAQAALTLEEASMAIFNLCYIESNRKALQPPSAAPDVVIEPGADDDTAPDDLGDEPLMGAPRAAGTGDAVNSTLSAPERLAVLMDRRLTTSFNRHVKKHVQGAFKLLADNSGTALGSDESPGAKKSSPTNGLKPAASPLASHPPTNVAAGWQEVNKPVSPKKDNPGHVMLSYNWGAQELVLKVQSRLEENGFKTWLDIDNMSGSILESMAGAIEDSRAFVFFMTSGYKESPNCRAECEYARQRGNALMIPVIAQDGY